MTSNRDMPGWKPSKLISGIPSGKTRVIGVDLFAFEEYLVKDCDTREEAFAIADEKNKNRQGSLYDVYYVYNECGEYIRGVDLQTGLIESRRGDSSP
jgi:hypothetical protein